MPRTPPAKQRLSRKESAARNRALLLDAAASLISRAGIGGASLDGIAAEAGLTKGAVYSQFDSKEDLLLALLDRRFVVGFEQLEAVFQADAPIESILAGLDAWHRGEAGDGRLWAILELELSLASSRQPRLRKKLRARQRATHAKLAETIERVSEQHGLELPLPPSEFAIILSAVSDGLLVRWLNDAKEIPEGLFGRFVAGIVASQLAASRSTTATRG